MKIAFKSLGFGLFAAILLLLGSSNSFSQEKESIEEEYFSMLRREVARVILRHPREPESVKYYAYSFEITYGEKISVRFSEETPKSIREKNETIDPGPKLKKFMEEKGIQFESEKTVLYTILHIWGDKKEREDNLAEVFEKIYDQGFNYPNASHVRVEIPIVTRLMGVRY